LFYHWDCTTEGQRYRFKSDQQFLSKLRFHPSLSKKMILKITDNINNAEEPRKKRKTKNKIKKNRFAVRKRRAAIKSDKQAAPNDPEEIMDYEDNNMDIEDDIDEEIANTL